MEDRRRHDRGWRRMNGLKLVYYGTATPALETGAAAGDNKWSMTIFARERTLAWRSGSIR